MRSIKVQYFLCYAVMGCVLPYLPVFLAARGLTDVQVGWVQSLSGWAVLVAPVLLTLLADTRLENKTILLWAFVSGAAGMAWLLLVGTFWPIFLANALFALALAPMISLQDGLNFAFQRKRVAEGGAAVPFHRVRIWGTIGFMVPAVVLYVWLTLRAEVSAPILIAGALCVAGAANAALLPRLRRRGAPPPETGPSRLPTLDAARLLLRPRTLVFCLAMWLGMLAMTSYYAFYPIYITRDLGIADRWVGLISALGVGVELIFMLAFGRLVGRLGIRGMLLLGASANALRLALLAAYPDPWVAVLTQTLHGPGVLLVTMLAPMYLDRGAGETFRNSTQGLYAMAVGGTARIVGATLAGYAADVSLQAMFGYAAIASAAALLILAAGYREDPGPR